MKTRFIDRQNILRHSREKLSTCHRVMKPFLTSPRKAVSLLDGKNLCTHRDIKKAICHQHCNMTHIPLHCENALHTVHRVHCEKLPLHNSTKRHIRHVITSLPSLSLSLARAISLSTSASTSGDDRVLNSDPPAMFAALPPLFRLPLFISGFASARDFRFSPSLGAAIKSEESQ